MNKKFYITTAIPYVNAAPHIGHALEFIQADTIARYHRLQHDETCLLSGGDENALKNVQAAEKAGVPLQEFIDGNTALFQQLASVLNVQFDKFQKGSDKTHHYPSSQKLWELCKANNDIYKKKYEGLYCVGCETFYTEDELNDKGECFEHPGKKLEVISEENYFFRLSAYQSDIIDILNGTHKTYPHVSIVPEKRKNEIVSFVQKGLEDISVSRSNNRAKNWGVPVPNDSTQRIYVWFDALNIYQSGIGFGWNPDEYSKWWPADVHVIGKGITRFHAIYWLAFLLSARLPLPKTIFVHEYFTVNGQKMSKTLGNVIDPIALVHTYQKYNGVDAIRYYILAKFSPFSDGDFSETEFRKTYNADLANGLGNLVSRVITLMSKLPNQFAEPLPVPEFHEILTAKSYEEYAMEMNNYRFDLALGSLWSHIKTLDVKINDVAPWKLPESERKIFLMHCAREIIEIAVLLQPFIPKTAETIIQFFTKSVITSVQPLFPRIP